MRMHARQATATAVLILILLAACAAAWRWAGPGRTQDQAATDPSAVALPIPPFPPRIASGAAYEQCLSALEDDPSRALAVAEGWEASGGGDGAAHCQGLALIAAGDPENGAERLETLVRGSSAPPLARAAVLGQAAQARLMAAQAGRGYDDATLALALAPDDTDLLLTRAMASAELEHWPATIQDLTRALTLNPSRSDALVMRAGAWRQQNRLDLALADAEHALSLDPDDAEALLERGIVRQRMGDIAGARADWLKARTTDPNSTTADLAEQNLALLEAGPNQR